MGDHVDVGTLIGRVGESRHAQGTDPHLHIDRLPSSYDERPGCASGDCLEYPFEVVQTDLIEAYQALRPNSEM